MSYIGLRIRYKDMQRPYKAPGGFLGALASIIIYVAMISQIGSEALFTGIILCVFSIIAYTISRRYNKSTLKDNSGDNEEEIIIEIPTDDEKNKMDKQYIVYKTVTIVSLYCHWLFISFR